LKKNPAWTELREQNALSLGIQMYYVLYSNPIWFANTQRLRSPTSSRSRGSFCYKIVSGSRHRWEPLVVSL